MCSFISSVRVSIVVSIPACHAGDRGSIPRHGDCFFILETSNLLKPYMTGYEYSGLIFFFFEVEKCLKQNRNLIFAKEMRNLAERVESIAEVK